MSVQFSSRLCLHAKERPYALQAVSQKLIGYSTLPWKEFHCWVDWRWSFFVVSRQTFECCHYLSLSPTDDRWCHTLSFIVHAGSISRPSKHQFSETQAISDGCFASQTYLPGHFPWFQMYRIADPQKPFWMSNIVTCYVGFPFQFSLSVGKLVESVRISDSTLV